MAAWSRLRYSFSSLPTSTSSTPSSSSASLSSSPSLLLDLADDLWFYSSVVPLPSVSLPCLPALFSPPSPDPSTLIAQCMITHLSPSPRILSLPLSSSSSSSSPKPPSSDLPPQSHLLPWDYDALPAPPDSQEDYANTFCEYNQGAYRGYNDGGYSSLSDSDGDEDTYRGYPRANTGEDEEGFHYYTAPSDWDDVPSDCEDEQEVQETLPANPHVYPDVLEPEDALSGIYDAALLLKDQHKKRIRFERDIASLEQREMKENLKMWAHAVASTLPWKAAAQVRPFL